MTEIIRNRTIGPSTKLEKSKSYTIDIKTVSQGDILRVNIDHKSNPFRKTFKSHGSVAALKDIICYTVNYLGTHIEIFSRSGATPIGIRVSKAIKVTSDKTLGYIVNKVLQRFTLN